MAATDTGGKIELKVEGMTCEHCEMKVHNAISGIAGVKKVSVNRKKGNAVAKIAKDAAVDPQALVSAVEEAGYTAASR